MYLYIDRDWDYLIKRKQKQMVYKRLLQIEFRFYFNSWFRVLVLCLLQKPSERSKNLAFLQAIF